MAGNQQGLALWAYVALIMIVIIVIVFVVANVR